MSTGMDADQESRQAGRRASARVAAVATPASSGRVTREGSERGTRRGTGRRVVNRAATESGPQAAVTGAVSRARDLAPAITPDAGEQTTAPPKPVAAPPKPGAPRPAAAKPKPVAQRAVDASGAQPVAGRTRRAPRAPFVLLVVGLLCGGLVSLLLLNTVLAQDSFELNDLRASTDELRQQAEELDKQVMYLTGPEAIAEQARGRGAAPDDSPPKFVSPAPDAR